MRTGLILIALSILDLSDAINSNTPSSTSPSVSGFFVTILVVCIFMDIVDFIRNKE